MWGSCRREPPYCWSWCCLALHSIWVRLLQFTLVAAAASCHRLWQAYRYGIQRYVHKQLHGKRSCHCRRRIALFGTEMLKKRCKGVNPKRTTVAAFVTEQGNSLSSTVHGEHPIEAGTAIGNARVISQPSGAPCPAVVKFATALNSSSSGWSRSLTRIMPDGLKVAL